MHMTIAQPIRVITYNIRYDNPGDGINAWPNRFDKVVSLIQKYNPDIIGIQEALHHQIGELVRVLPEYSYAGVGRDDGKVKGEFCAILFKRGRFGLLNNGTFWLSENPAEPGSKNWDAAITRIATWIRLYDRDAKSEFLFLNTHFDHVGKLAREKSIELIKIKLVELAHQKPVLVVGDFNCTPQESPYQKITDGDGFQLFDSTIGVPSGTFCGFETGGECRPIDYIFHSNEWRVKSYFVISDNDGKHYPSDHLPVLAELYLAKEN